MKSLTHCRGPSKPAPTGVGWAEHDRVRSAQLSHLPFELGQAGGVIGRGAWSVAPVDLGPDDPVRSVSGLMPSCAPIRFNAPVRVAGSRRASTAIRVARSRSSSGYFLGAAMTLILTWIESLHQTRGGTVDVDLRSSRRR